ncbi:hypothetical protein SAMN02745704_01660 [Paucidesulfovibrio gracilis DSM 16080]|uniref:Uncharacterized protein n=1 Tax=Paucidesulfovibrio gracilis DSM 16080 TaxID=1121449 RepID=A0A1T4X217_9BACT|nr:hypothetical protein [Paucidesulfovibrio gracilis]SKA83529.1 hypothetical protein SAMN02745704_01660 [Paucidesulfovibrio gracilis DSM 16080]
MSWVVAESFPLHEMEPNGLTKENLQGRWEEVADDMALIPERNVRVVEENGIVRVEVSEEMYDCMRGM